MFSFQQIIITLQSFWINHGCLLQQSFDSETGAGTFNPESLLRCLGPEPYQVCHVEISRRPTDGRYGLNPNRLQQFHQFQVIIKPPPQNVQDLYLQSLKAIGFDLKKHDIRFMEDDWESPSLGAWGLGWQIWCNGTEISQFTYFQCVSGQELQPISVELTYGLERIAMCLQKITNVFMLAFNDNVTYGDVFLQNEIEWSQYNFETADEKLWWTFFEGEEREAQRLVKMHLPIPAYSFVVKASHSFNILDARGVISPTMRIDLIHRIRSLSCAAASEYLKGRKKQKFPLLHSKNNKKDIVQKGFFTKIKEAFSQIKEKEDFLLEIGSEELPPNCISIGLASLTEICLKFFTKHNLSFQSYSTYGSPRRLAIIFWQLNSHTPKKSIIKMGPTVESAFNSSGYPTEQGQQFVISTGYTGRFTLKSIEKKEIPHVYIHHHRLQSLSCKSPKETMTLLKFFLPLCLSQISFPKSMRWEESEIMYARPIRWIVSLFGPKIISFHIADVIANNASYGHKQLSHKMIYIQKPKKYEEQLQRQYVIASPEQRKKLLNNQLEKFEEQLSCYIPHKEEILQHAIYTTEYPTIVVGSFDAKFLSLPPELLISEMVFHQKYFPLQQKFSKKLSHKFLVTVDTLQRNEIIQGYESVLSARFADGLFLYEQDKKIPLDQFRKALKNIIFHQNIGSMYEKTLRIEKLVIIIATQLNLEPPIRAAQLCKADSASSVVNEFPELQGIMGYYYAKHQNESDEVAIAIKEHILPKTEQSKLPQTVPGSLLALADKLDTICSHMNAGIKATASKDPYGLRRGTISIIRILLEQCWSLNLSEFNLPQEGICFFHKRMQNILQKYLFSKEEIAFIPFFSMNPYEIFLRTKALHEFRKQNPTLFCHLQTSYKRIKGQIQGYPPMHLDTSFLQEKEEQDLAAFLIKLQEKIQKGHAQKDFPQILEDLSSMYSPLMKFFHHLHILSDNKKLKTNRISILQSLMKCIEMNLNLSHHSSSQLSPLQ